MTTLTKTNVATRGLMGDLEQRVGGKRRLFIIGGIGGLILLLMLLRLASTGKKAAALPPPRPVVVARVTTQDVPIYLDEIGTTAAYETVDIKAQVTGQIISREFNDGAEVKKGQLLFRIDPRPYEAALASAQADQALNDANWKRQVELRAKNVTATQDWDTAKASAMRAEAAVAAAKVNLDFCSIQSPIDGRAGLRNVDAGNVVSPSSPALVTVQRLDPIYTDFTISETDIAFVRKYLGGPNVKVETRVPDNNKPALVGDLYFIDNAVQPGAGTVKARAVSANADRALWPSQFVRVRLILDIIPQARLVPRGAVQIGQNGPYVFVVKADSTLDLRAVKPGQPQGDMIVISEGLNPGETVVVAGQLQLAPGAKVQPTPTEQAAEKSKPAPGNS